MKFLSQINVNTEYTLPIVDGANGQVLATDGNGTAYWGSISVGATNLNALTDVVISSPSTGQLLRYGIPVGSEDPNPVWYNWSPNYLTFSSSIDALGDVTITTATAGQILQYNGTAWVNTTLSTVEYVSKVQHIIKAGVAITKGQAVYITGSDGTNMIAGLASNTSEIASSKVMGLAASTAAINGQIFVVTEGLLAGLNTSTATAGDPVWLGANGNLIFGLLGKPTSPLHLVYIGVVTRVQQNNGEIFVKVQNGIEIDEIHDVQISSPATGQLLRRDTDGYWKNWTPNFLTAEADTLATVTARGATTTGNIVVNGEISLPSYIRLTNAGVDNAFISESWGINLNGVSTHPVQVRGASFSVGYSLGAGTSYGSGNLFVSNKIGVNTTAPTKLLDVVGSGIVASFGGAFSPGSFAGIHFGYSETQYGNDNYKKSALVFERTDNHIGQGGNASGKIHFLLNNAGNSSATSLAHSAVTIDTNANGTAGTARVGIATTSPNSTLDVNGAANATSFSSTALFITNADTSGSLQPAQGDPANKIYSFRWQGNEGGYIDTDNKITFSGFKTPTGTASQFLKANGTVDSNTYVTSTALNGYATETWVNANFYNEGEIDDFFSGAEAIGGYNKSNWDAAYNDKINSASFSTTTGVLTLTQQDTGTVTVDLDGRYLESLPTATSTVLGGIKVGTNLSISNGVLSATDTDTVTSVGIDGDLSTGNIELRGGGATTITKSGGTITISSTDTDTNTTYSAGTGLTLTGTTFSVTSGTYAAASHNHDDRYYTETESDSRFVNASGDTMSGSLSFDAAAVIKKRITGVGDNPVKTASGVLASRSDNGGGATYYIIETNVPQDEYQMGGFTIELFGRYGETNNKTKIDLGGYWNPEGNGGFIGFEAHGTNPEYKPTIQVARNNNTGNTAFIISGVSWSYPVIVARDLWLGYSQTDGGSYGEGWVIASASNIDSYSNRDTVVWRNGYSDSNPAGYITGYTETDTLASVTGRGASTSTTLNLNGRVNIGNGLARPNALNSDSVAHARIGGSDVHLYVASLEAAGGYRVAVQAARTSDFASFGLDLQSNGGTLFYGGNEIATRTWVQSQGYLTSETDSQTLSWDFNSKNLSITNGNTVTLDGLATEEYVTSQGYITGYTETDTLATVTSRGASTSTALTFSGGSGTTPTLALDRNIATPSNYYNGLQFEVRATSGTAGIGLHRNGYSHVGIYHDSSNELKFNMNSGTPVLSANAGTIWGSGNDGSGSGLDADLLDGNHASAFATRQDGARYTTNFNSILSSGFFNGDGQPSNAPDDYGQLIVAKGIDTGLQIFGGYDSNNLWFRGWGYGPEADGFYPWRKIWHDGNDGAGTGLDADLLDGQQGSYYQPASTAITTSNIGSQSVSYATTSGNSVSTDQTNFSELFIENSAVATKEFVTSQGYLTSLPSHNHDDRYYTESESDSRYFIKSGSWLGDLASYGYTREVGIQMTGGSEFVILSKAGQGYTLVDGSYLAYEGGGFYSSNNSAGNTLLGFYADTTSSVNFNTPNVKANGNAIWHAGNDGSGSGLDADLLDGNHASAFYLATNPSGYITGSYLDDYTRGAYRVISDYGSNTTWYIRSNGQFIFGTGHDWTASFRLNIDNGSGYASNGSWAYFGQQDSNATNGTWRGVRIRKFAGGSSVDGDLSAGAYYIGTTRKDTNWDAAYTWGNHADYAYWNTDSVDAKNVQSAEVIFAGNVTVEGTFTESSSIRFKENIAPLDPALDKVNQLEAVSYNKIGVDDREIGLIAEDVAELFPEVVTYNEEGQPQGIQYQRLSVILLKAVQELTERVNKLENK